MTPLDQSVSILFMNDMYLKMFKKILAQKNITNLHV